MTELPARLSLVTLGVVDVQRSTTFYQAFGWTLSSASVPSDVSFFKTHGGILALYGAADLAADAALTHTPGQGGFRGVALAMNLDSPEQVDLALDIAVTAGGTVLRPARATDWGGYSGYFTDPDGHAWEVAHNPGFPIGPDGRPTLP